MSSHPKRSLTGITPSGQVHIGNYLGMIKPAIARQNDGYECFYFVSDLHSLTSLHNKALLPELTYDLVATWLACGFDHKKHILYRQSDIPEVAEFTWYLSCVTGMGLLEKCHAYKDKVSHGKDASHGLFAYPVLMAADILMYAPDIVPVGKDQKQHVEVARDIAGSFNAIFGEGLLKIPEVAIQEDVMTVPGLDGQKMSKSYNNTIPLFSTRDELKKKCLLVKTDSTPLESPKSMKGGLLGDLFSYFATAQEFNDLELRLQAGGLGWGHAKLELFEAMDRELTPLRERYEALRSDIGYLNEVLADGARRAREVGLRELQKVRDAVGIGKKL